MTAEERASKTAVRYQSEKNRARWRRLCAFLKNHPGEAREYEDQMLDQGKLVRNKRGTPVEPGQEEAAEKVFAEKGKLAILDGNPDNSGEEEPPVPEVGEDRHKRRLMDLAGKELSEILVIMDSRVLNRNQMKACVAKGSREPAKDAMLKIITRCTNVTQDACLGYAMLRDIEKTGMYLRKLHVKFGYRAYDFSLPPKFNGRDAMFQAVLVGEKWMIRHTKAKKDAVLPPALQKAGLQIRDGHSEMQCTVATKDGKASENCIAFFPQQHKEARDMNIDDDDDSALDILTGEAASVADPVTPQRPPTLPESECTDVAPRKPKRIRLSRKCQSAVDLTINAGTGNLPIPPLVFTGPNGEKPSNFALSPDAMSALGSFLAGFSPAGSAGSAAAAALDDEPR